MVVIRPFHLLSPWNVQRMNARKSDERSQGLIRSCPNKSKPVSDIEAFSDPGMAREGTLRKTLSI